MNKNIILGSVLLGIVFLTGCGQKSIEKQPVLSPTTTQTNNETSSWQTHQNEKFGIKFKYPQEILFDKGAETNEGEYEVGGNFTSSGDNYLNFRVIDKTEGLEIIDSLKYQEKNIIASNEVNFQNGKLIQVDGYGTGGYYFVNAYYAGKDYVYHFMMSRPNHSKELLRMFETILNSAELTK